MSDKQIIYRNGRGQIKHYEISEVSRDETHLEAIHDGRFKTFRIDSVLEWLEVDDDPDSHLAYWQATEPAKKRGSVGTSPLPGRDGKPDKIPFPNRGQAAKTGTRKLDRKNAVSANRRPTQWRDFWKGFFVAVALFVVLLILVPASGG